MGMRGLDLTLLHACLKVLKVFERPLLDLVNEQIALLLPLGVFEQYKPASI